MTDTFEAIAERLKTALGLAQDKHLAGALGLAPNTLHNRKARNSPPHEQIDVVCAAAGLNPNWVYRGEGAIYAGNKEVQRRAKLIAEVTEALLPLRLPPDVRSGLERLLAQAVGGNSEGTVREWQAVRAPMTTPEQELLDAYRQCDETMRQAFDSLAKAVSEKSSAGVQQRLGLSGAPKSKPTPMTVDRDPETARMKPKEKAAYLAAKAAKK